MSSTGHGIKTKIFRATVALILFSVFGTALARAQSWDIPNHRWGLSFGNSRRFTGLRFNFRDSQVERITGINFTLWQPRKDNEDAVVTGMSLGTLPGGARLRGIQLGIAGVMSEHTITGISIAGLGIGSGDKVTGINIAGLGIGTGKKLKGINIAGLGIGAGENVTGINIAGLGIGAGRKLRGINIAGLGVGAGDYLYGISVGGIGAGAGKDVMGFNVGGVGLGAGKRLVGINVAGVGMGAGERLVGLNVCGLAAGSTEVCGLTIAGGVVGGETLRGLQIAGGVVHVIKGGQLIGGAISPFNYVRGAQTGISIGIVNYAWSVKGLELGLVNIVRDNPKGLKVLPVFNTSF